MPQPPLVCPAWPADSILSTEVHHPAEREEGGGEWGGVRKAAGRQGSYKTLQGSSPYTAKAQLGLAPGPVCGLGYLLPIVHMEEKRPHTSSGSVFVCFFCSDLGQLEICVMYDIPVLIALPHCESWLESLIACRAVVEDCSEGRVFV